ncbi:hypothetical protein FA95DRAFT_1571685 [Auriscalpium vulgare]|uniref:Uncharacterized protein n=1 Tax=Auriscalpium vulgare TaxID=40419 RepID=A0ACB8RWV1_9AGAM|nr:hypothetical protein FA95DRAFT_1571685 [Auriscalpium vulgare]
MARGKSASSDVEMEAETSKTSNKEAEVEAHDEGSGEEEEEEFEIEAILDAKLGAFTPGQHGYLVKWKGFGHEDNSWVAEEDAGNAQDLIDEYWRKAKGKTAKRKSETKPAPPAPKPTPAKKASVKEDTPEPEEAPAKKRGRGRPKVKVDTEDEEDEEDSAKGKKRGRKSNGTAGAAAKRTRTTTPTEHVELPPPMQPSTQKKYKDIASWENLVENVDTVEKAEDGNLYVYFTLTKNQTHCKELSEVCAKKFPQKLIKFYEGNLRWKASEEEAD